MRHMILAAALWMSCLTGCVTTGWTASTWSPREDHVGHLSLLHDGSAVARR